MIRIVCTKCKNAYLQNDGDNLVCPSCGAAFSAEEENLLLGIQYFNEGNLSGVDDYLMKYIVKNGAEPRAIIYKALCDAYNFDEDTVSLKETYTKILEALQDISDDLLPQYIAIANDEAKKVEVALTESHIRLFADADAEKIKKQVATVLDIQKEARAFRSSLIDVVNAFNERNAIQLSVKFSDCFFVSNEIAEEVGNNKYQKICDNIAAHTVFTGILSNDIKNLEIYYRCIVMFFEKSYDKYKFLLNESVKFTELAEILEQGQYNTIKGTAAIGTKLKGISYEFLEESYKEHFDENIDMQTETVVIIEPVVEPEVEETPEFVDVVSDTTAEETDVVEPTEITEDVIEIESTENDSVIEIAEDAEEASDEEPEAVVLTEDVVEANAENEEDEENAVTDIISEEVIEAVSEESSEDVADEVTEVETANEETTEVIDTAVVETVEDAVEDAVEETTEDTEADNETVENVVESDAAEADIVTADNKDNIEETATVAESKKKKKKSHKGVAVLFIIIIAAVAFAGYKFGPGLINDYKYENGVELFKSGKYDDAAAVFADLKDYKDSKEKFNESIYTKATELEEAGNFEEAIAEYKDLDDYQDCGIRIQACTYSLAKIEMDNGNYDKATEYFKSISEYGDSSTMISECIYRKAVAHIENKEVAQAIELLNTIPEYSDASEKINEAKYVYVTENFVAENETTVTYLNELALAKYRNSAELRTQLLGSANVTSGKIKAFVNYSTSDLETSLSELDNGKTCYFHVVVEDESLYGERLSIKYKTQFGYSQSKSVTLSAEKNSSYVSYPPTKFTNYGVTFQLLDSNGNVLAEQKITF